MYGSSSAPQKHMIYPVSVGGGGFAGFVLAQEWIYERREEDSRRYDVGPDKVEKGQDGYRRLDMT
jgi:hypothetical protein